jgi:ferredoxin
MDKDGKPIEDTGFLAPVILADKCVGCGLCETRCYRINVLQKRLIEETAIRVVAGPGKEDRLMRDSYLALREVERRRKRRQQDKLRKGNGARDSYLPDFLK